MAPNGELPSRRVLARRRGCVVTPSLQHHMAGGLTDLDQEKFGVDSYYNAGTTRTKANSTLFLAFRDVQPPVPPEQRAPMTEAMFSVVPGYIGVRQVRAMCFVDFEDIKSATAAMMKYQGHNGLTIDYDKVNCLPQSPYRRLGVASLVCSRFLPCRVLILATHSVLPRRGPQDTGVATKRKRQREEATQRGQHEAQSASYYCAACGTKALRTSGTLLSALPARSTDGARVVDEASDTPVTLLLEPVGAMPDLVRRAKGVEKQFRLGKCHASTWHLDLSSCELRRCTCTHSSLKTLSTPPACVPFACCTQAVARALRRWRIAVRVSPRPGSSSTLLQTPCANSLRRRCRRRRGSSSNSSSSSSRAAAARCRRSRWRGTQQPAQPPAAKQTAADV